MSPPGSGGRERVSSNMPGHEGWVDRGIAIPAPLVLPLRAICRTY